MQAVFIQKEIDFYDACLLILRTVVHFYENANATRESRFSLLLQCSDLAVLPPARPTIQEEAIDYIGGFFPVVDCYLNIESESLRLLTPRSNDLLDRSFKGMTYLQLLMKFVTESVFDPELGDSEQAYAIGVLMIIVQYKYRRKDSVL